MATIITLTAAKDVFTGTAADEIIYADAGDDRVLAGAGNDIVYGGLGNDTLTGDGGNDVLYGGEGNDIAYGGGGNDIIYGENGNDTIFADGGNDIIYGGAGINTLSGSAGDDTFYVSAGTSTNTIDGGSGNDTIVLDISSAALTPAMRADLATLKSWMDSQAAAAGTLANQTAQTTGTALTLSALGLTVSLIETVKIMVDGVETPITSLFNLAPVTAATVSISTQEDTPVSGQVAVSGANGNILSFTASQGPAHGTLTLNAATGAYTYAANADYNGADSFQVIVSDGNGGTATQTVSVGIAAVNDAPVTAATASITTIEDTPVSGQVTATDVDGDTLTFATSQGPANGTLTLM